MKRRIFVTGSSGFIGRNLVESLRDRYTIYAPTSKQLNLLDTQAVSRYIKKYAFDTVIHTATHNATATSTKDRSQVFSSNIRMFMNVARLHHSYRRMIYFGSAAEYHKEKIPKYVKEEFFDCHVPVTDYGFSKYLMAKIALPSANIYDLRLFGVYGKYEDHRIRFISNALFNVIHNRDIRIHQNAWFDYLYVDDLAPIIDWFIRVKNLKHHAYNVCSGTAYQLKTIASTILRVTKSKKKIIVEQKGNKPPLVGDATRLHKEIGTLSMTPLEQGIAALYGWYKDHDV